MLEVYFLLWAGKVEGTGIRIKPDEKYLPKVWNNCENPGITLDNRGKSNYSKAYTKAEKKRSKQLSLTERDARWLEGILRKRLPKVALEPGS